MDLEPAHSVSGTLEPLRTLRMRCRATKHGDRPLVTDTEDICRPKGYELLAGAQEIGV